MAPQATDGPVRVGPQAMRRRQVNLMEDHRAPEVMAQVQAAAWGPWRGLHQVQARAAPDEIIRRHAFALESLQQSLRDLAAAAAELMPEVTETIRKVEGLMMGMRHHGFAQGPVITVMLNMERKMVEFLKISGDQFCEGVPLSEAPCTDPWDLLQFKPFVKELLARAPWGDGILDVEHVLDDNGQQLGDAADIAGLTRLTIQTLVVFPEALSDAARIEHCLRTLHSNTDALPSEVQRIEFVRAHKKCKRNSRDLLVTTAWDSNRDTFLANLQVAYEGMDLAFDKTVRAQMLLAFHKL